MTTAPDLPASARTVIVGGGLAGLELARELEARGCTGVLVLEAGPDGDARHVNVTRSAEDALRLWLEPATDPAFHQPWTSLTPPHYTGASGVRGRLGGRSLYWYGVTLPLEDWALAEPWWPRAVVADLTESWQGGPPLYERVTQRLREWQAGEGPGQDDAVAVAGTLLRPTPRARRPAPGGAGRWYAYSPLDTWRDAATGDVVRQPEGIRFVPGAEAVRVVVQDGVCRGVVVRTAPRPGERAAERCGPDVEIAAERVVLCAGTLENSRLAIQALAETDPGRTPRLGRLADHIVQGVFLRLEGERARRLVELLPPGSYVAPGPRSARSNLFVDVHTRPDSGVLLEVRAMGEQLPNEDSFVACVPGGRHPWPVTVTSSPSAQDRALLVEQQRMLRDFLARVTGALGDPVPPPVFARYDEPVRGNACALPEAVAEMPVDTFVTWANSIGTEDHEGGTLPLGGILDDDHQFHAVPGLFAAGPATFPRLGAANPSLTTLALAHRLAAKLAAAEQGANRVTGAAS